MISHALERLFVITQSGKTRISQVTVCVHSVNSIRATKRGLSQLFIFCAARANIVRRFFGELLKGHASLSRPANRWKARTKRKKGPANRPLL